MAMQFAENIYVTYVQSVIHLGTRYSLVRPSVRPAARAGEKGGSSCLLIFRGCPFGTQDAPSRRTVGDTQGPKPKRSSMAPAMMRSRAATTGPGIGL